MPQYALLENGYRRLVYRNGKQTRPFRWLPDESRCKLSTQGRNPKYTVGAEVDM